jgi:hypothetical protein
MGHSVAGREECVMCHPVDLQPQSHQGAAFENQDCLLCHQEAAAADVGGEPEAGGDVSFANDVLPALEANCATCHGAMALGGLQVTDYETLLSGGASGLAIVAGSPDDSPIVVKMGEEHPAVLGGDDLSALIDWIAAGAADN